MYHEAVHHRKGCTRCGPALTNPALCESGKYDSDEIGPWSRWHGNLDAKLMIVGQDWGDRRYFIEKRGVDGEENRTNKRVVEFVGSIGVDMDDVFLTNAILCLKEGGMQAAVTSEWFSNCGDHFLSPIIEIVRPRVLVTLGERAYRSVELTFKLRYTRFRDAVENSDGLDLGHGTLLFPVYHCSDRILNTHRCRSMQEEDWQRIRKAL